MGDAGEFADLVTAFRTILQHSGRIGADYRAILTPARVVAMGADPADADEVAAYMRAVFELTKDESARVEALPPATPAVRDFFARFKAMSAAAWAASPATAAASARAAAAADAAESEPEKEAWRRVNEMFGRHGHAEIAGMMQFSRRGAETPGAPGTESPDGDGAEKR